MKTSCYNSLLLYIAILLILHSCDKADISFEDDGNATDPNITYVDNNEVKIETYKLDSFVNSGRNVFMLGSHYDSLFAKISSNSFAEIEIPAENPVKDKEVLLDSLVLILVPNGNYYGDTTAAISLSVHRLQQKIENDSDTLDNRFFYPRTFVYDPSPIGTTTSLVFPRKKKELSIRLSDAIGADWLLKLKGDKNEVESQYEFRKYFNGICIRTDSLVNNTIYYFNSTANNAIIRLHYKEKNVFLTNKVLEFKYRSASQFNNIVYNYSKTPFAVFSPYKKQVKSSSSMKNRAYVSNNIPCYVKITFPNLLSLKELYPYIKIIRADLEIKPAPGTFSYPYSLPGVLQMYTSNGDNLFNDVLRDPVTSDPQTGNLVIDRLYGDKTLYTFNVTNFVNDVLQEGRFSEKAIFLSTNAGLEDAESSRLIINEPGGRNGIKLKLYVLGL
jgi:hypothetical protein